MATCRTNTGGDRARRSKATRSINTAYECFVIGPDRGLVETARPPSTKMKPDHLAEHTASAPHRSMAKAGNLDAEIAHLLKP
ncbi:hypothetical protein V5E97_12370 [Singulisphaera sp. Ch08]|uniref:Uncharacterized protein n=1 Tax=Singulisphaera sp. Ch08 TaxID=3120278 RepID=A0AAU7CPE8_9BACT